MKKRAIVLVLCSILAGTSACGTGAGNNAGASRAGDSTGSGTEKEKFTVGICQLVQHDALDMASKGFEDTLREEFGDGITIDVQNAQGDAATCSTIINGFVANDYDLILANATPALQSAASATSDIPVLGTAVTDYAGALNLTDFQGTTGMNISGTSDLGPLDQQEDMIMELVPDVSRVSILYCSAEPNSKFQAEKIEEFLKEDGVDFKEFTFADSNDIQSVAAAAAADCDAIYIPTDNTAASNMTLVSNITQAAGIPVICGEENMCRAGGLATLSISYYELGQKTGRQAIEILKNGADPAGMPVETVNAAEKKFNQQYADAIGMTMPEDYKVIE